MRKRIVTGLLAGSLAATAVTAAGAAEGGRTERVSVRTDEGQATGALGSIAPALSPDGRFVAFESAATNLVPGDTNNASDIFIRDRRRGTTERVSVGTGGAQAVSGGIIGGSSRPAISADGRFVAFRSDAANLVPGDTNDEIDVFVHDRQSGRTERVSVRTGGAQANRSSDDPVISADGRFVAFTSLATNLVRGDTNGLIDVFVHDRQRGTTERVNVRSDGGQVAVGNSPSISADGRFVAFTSSADDLVPGDTNRNQDVFVRDRREGTTERVSLRADGRQSNGFSFDPAISADGRFVAFESRATNLVPGDTNRKDDVFVRDRRAGRTERVSVATGGGQATGGSSDPSSGGSGAASISPDGRYVAFNSDATNLVPGDTNGVDDVFVRDRQTGRTERVSVGARGTQADGFSLSPSISADGREVAFQSSAGNLVPRDTNGDEDVFVRVRPE